MLLAMKEPFVKNVSFTYHLSDNRYFILVLVSNSSDFGSPCICAPSGEFCMAYDGMSDILEIWRYLNGEAEEEAQFIEAMGFKVTMITNLFILF